MVAPTQRARDHDGHDSASSFAGAITLTIQTDEMAVVRISHEAGNFSGARNVTAVDFNGTNNFTLEVEAIQVASEDTHASIWYFYNNTGSDIVNPTLNITYGGIVKEAEFDISAIQDVGTTPTDTGTVTQIAGTELSAAITASQAESLYMDAGVGRFFNTTFTKLDAAQVEDSTGVGIQIAWGQSHAPIGTSSETFGWTLDNEPDSQALAQVVFGPADDYNRMIMAA